MQGDGEETGKVVAGLQVFWIDEQGAVHPFLGPFGIPEFRERTGPEAHSRAIVRILRQSPLRPGERDPSGAASLVDIPKGVVTGNQHGSRVNIRFHQSHRLLVMRNGILVSVLPEVEQGY